MKTIKQRTDAVMLRFGLKIGGDYTASSRKQILIGDVLEQGKTSSRAGKRELQGLLASWHELGFTTSLNEILSSKTHYPGSVWNEEGYGEYGREAFVGEAQNRILKLLEFIFLTDGA